MHDIRLILVRGIQNRCALVSQKAGRVSHEDAMRTRLLAWLAFTFVLVDIACSATHFAIRDGNIEEIGSSKAVDVDPPPPAQKRLPLDRKKPRAAKRDNAARARKPIVGATTLWPAVKLMKGWQNGSPGTYALSVLNPR